jgi:hypothetical protein
VIDPRAVRFTVVGLPQPKGSSKAFRHNKTQKIVVHADNRKKLKPWEASVRAAALVARGRRPMSLEPMALDIAFFFPRPVSVT